MKRIYTEEFRKMAVELSYNSDKPLTHICKELGLSGSLLYKFRKDMSNEVTSPDSK